MKNIIIVGNGHHNNRELGEKIDSFEYVVRMNRFPEGYEKYIGKKLNCWIINKTLVQQDKKYNQYQLMKQKYPYLEYIGCLSWRNYNIENLTEYKHTFKAEGFEILDSINTLNWLQEKYIQYNYPQPFPRVSTGIVTIVYFLNEYPSITICNFDFGKSYHFWEAKGGRNIIGPHNWQFEKNVIEYFKLLGRITIL